MKLYLISQSVENGYDTYSDAVVAAENEQAAKETHPSGSTLVVMGDMWMYACDNGSLRRSNSRDWAARPSQVSAEYLGEAAEGVKAGVVCASFHAG